MEENQKDGGDELSGYLTYFANIADEVSKFPFTVDELILSVKVNSNLHEKIHKEIEELTGMETKGSVPDNYDIKISAVVFRFEKT